MIILEAAVCGAVDLHCLMLAGVSIDFPPNLLYINKGGLINIKAFL